MEETPLNQSLGEILQLEVHYGGTFNGSGRGSYINENTIQQYLKWDSDLNYDVIAKAIQQDVDNVAQLFYKIYQFGPLKHSLRVLACQQDFKDMLESVSRRLLKSNLVEIYVQHIDGYESDTASLEHLSDSDEELYDIRMKKLEARAKKDANVQDEKYEQAIEEEEKHDEPQQEWDEWFSDRIGTENGCDNAAEVAQPLETNGRDHGWDNAAEVTQPLGTNGDDIWKGVTKELSVDDGEDSDGLRSEYPDSDDYDSPTMCSDDEELRRMVPYFPTFNPNFDPFKFEPVVGLKFKDPTQLKMALRYYAVEHKLCIRFARSRSNYVVAKCRPTCTWRLYASYMRDEASFQIKSLKKKHKCSKAYHIPIANSRWIAKVFHNKIINNPKMKWKELKEEVKDRYHLEVTENQCGKAKKICLGEVDDIMKKHYAKLYDYAAEVRKSIPDSSVKIMVDRPTIDNPGYFQRMYVCLGPLKKCWKLGCRPVIGVDGCFLKTYCKGELLTAIGRDGNNWMFPIAWAIVESETKDAWLWFLGQLSEDLNLGDGRGFTMISDQQKGLETSIQFLLPKIEHRMCARHVYANFRGLFSGGHLKNLFWQAAKCGTEREFDDIMNEIGEVNPEAREYLLVKKNPKQWCRAWFGSVSGCDSVENNMCETFNGVIVEARTLKIIDMLEDIRMYITKRMLVKAREIETWEGPVCPRIMKKMDKLEEKCGSWRSYFCGGREFEVKSRGKGYKVDLEHKICACRQWDVSGIPCVHALAVLLESREEKTNFVAAWFKTDKIKLCYSEYLGPLNGENLWPKTSFLTFLPPNDRRMPGRPKKQRRKSRHESPVKGKGKGVEKNVCAVEKVSKRGGSNRCSLCKEAGHNKATCKQKDVVGRSTMESVSQGSTLTTDLPVTKVQAQESTIVRPIAANKEKSATTVGDANKTFKPPQAAKFQATKPQVTKTNPKTTRTQPQVTKPLAPAVRSQPQSSKPSTSRRPPNGFGVYTCPDTGSVYMKPPAAKRGRWITNFGPRNQATIPHKVASEAMSTTQGSTNTVRRNLNMGDW